jgi:beta-glucanase (GH16 family)
MAQSGSYVARAVAAVFRLLNTPGTGVAALWRNTPDHRSGLPRAAPLTLLFLLPLLASCAGPSARDPRVPPPIPPSGYALVWADEFNVEGAPDPANWGFERGFVRNHEAQFYQPDNARVKDGLLVIEARREAVPNPKHEPGSPAWKRQAAHSTYTSASVLTRGLHQWRYGRFELRARIDVRSGLWPAWWTLGVAGEWPANGEIDIMEYYRGKVLANVGSGTRERHKAKWHSETKPLSELGGAKWAAEFHTWRMDWTSDTIRLYLDEQLMNETQVADTKNPDGTMPFRQPHFMILNLALGGDNGGDLPENSLPAKFEIDWVRVYQAQP